MTNETMTPQEKAEELKRNLDIPDSMFAPQATKALLTALDDILNSNNVDTVSKAYWNEVKKEIESLENPQEPRG